MEESFEKKAHKKIWIIVPIIVFILVITTVIGLIIISNTKKPENIFKKVIEEAFKINEPENVRTQRIEYELSLSMESINPEIKAVNEILKAIKLKTTTEIDLDKKICNGNLLATYDGQQIISIDGLIQNEKMFFYIKDIYDKYIQINEEYFEGIELSEIFETKPVISDEDIVNSIKQILLDVVNSKEIKQQEIKLEGKKAQKSTLRLTPKEVLEISLEIMKKINEYQPNTEISDLIAELEYQIANSEETENYMDLSIYTKGLKNEVVKIDAVLINVEENEVIIFETNIISEEESVINFLINEESTDVSGAVKLMEITINTENENNGTATIKMNTGENSIALKMKYSVYNNPEIKERDTSNSIMIDSVTETDAIEMFENAQKNEILYGIIQMFMTDTEEKPTYDY